MALWGGGAALGAASIQKCPPHLWDIMLTKHHLKSSKRVTGSWWNTELGVFHPPMDKVVSPLEQRVAKLLTRSVYPSMHDAHPGSRKVSIFGPGKTQFFWGGTHHLHTQRLQPRRSGAVVPSEGLFFETALLFHRTFLGWIRCLPSPVLLCTGVRWHTLFACGLATSPWSWPSKMQHPQPSPKITKVTA